MRSKLITFTLIGFLNLFNCMKNRIPSVIQWDPCTSDDSKQVGEIRQIRVYANCSERCQLKLNSSIELEVDFEPGENTTSLTSEMVVVLGSIEIPFPELRASICDSVTSSDGQTCPLFKGKFYTYRKKMPIKDDYPPIDIDIKWRFLTDTNQTSICFAVKSQLIE